MTLTNPGWRLFQYTCSRRMGKKRREDDLWMQIPIYCVFFLPLMKNVLFLRCPFHCSETGSKKRGRSTMLDDRDNERMLLQSNELNKMELSMMATNKSLFFCLVLDNPFDPKNPERRIVDEKNFRGELGDGTPDSGTFLEDDEFLMHKSERAPNKFQKVIEVILRLRKREVDMLPENMLERVPTSRAGMDPNYFHGYRLVEENLLLAPDRDELYIKLHCRRDVLLAFAEIQGIQLNTHPYSYAGGAPVAYQKELEKKLTDSVELFMKAFPNDLTMQNDEGAIIRVPNSNGFVFDVPDKMRIMVRMIHEAWKFGGCGLQIAELKRKEVLVRNFFPPAQQRLSGALRPG